MINTIIIEDELAIQKELNFLVKQHSNKFNITGTATNVGDAIQLIQDAKPQLVLMDIQLVDGTAFDILNQLSSYDFLIVFITAYNQFAIKAIKAGSFDYLLKPINEEELNETLDRVVSWYERNKVTSVSEQVNTVKQFATQEHENLDQQICIASVDYIQFVKINEISYCSAVNSYTHIHLTNGKKITATKSLKYYEELLPERWFLRIHQSHIVNKNFVDKILKNGGLITKNGEELPIAGRRREYVLEQMMHFKG